MLKFTPGKWNWKLAVLDNGDQRVIFVDENSNEIHPTLGDVTLMAAAPEMYELLKEYYSDSYQGTGARLKIRTGELLARIDGKEKRR